MYEVLREHPEVFVPAAKDLQFFDDYYDKGLAWYLSHFRGARGKKAAGEVSHNYYLSNEAARRIRAALPNVKLICCLREVVNKIVSGYVYNISTELKDVSLEEYVQMPQVVKQGDYYNNLKVFYDMFPPENILVLFYEELKKDPRAFVRRLYAFLGVDPDFHPASLLERVNPAHEARVEWLAHLAYRIACGLRRVGLANLVGVVKRNRFFERLLYKKKDRKMEISEMLRRRVRAKYGKDYDKLAALIGRSLPEEWFC